MEKLIELLNLSHFGNAADRNHAIARIRELTMHTHSIGKMEVQELVVHMTDILRVPLGEKPIVMNTSWWAKLCRKKLIRPLVLWLPWVPGIPSEPEFLPSRLVSTEHESAGRVGTKPSVGGLKADIELLIDAIKKVGELTDEQAAKYPHPVFDVMTALEWQRLMYHHVRHHLWQLGKWPLGF